MSRDTRIRSAATAVALLATLLAVQHAGATPSTQVWIPSPDIQQFGTLHLNSDIYARPERNPILMLGPTVGFLPFEKLQAEAGLDLIFQGDEDLDNSPFYFHGKLAVPEDALFKWQPALAAGIYNVGTARNEAVNTMQNVGYALLGRTLPVVGRLSAGYYLGNAAVLRKPIFEGSDATEPDNHGLLLSWDRTMSEISDKLWLAVDFQQGQNALGALNVGAAWAFTKEISVLIGYDHYWNQATAGKDTFTVQLDVNLFLPKERPAAAPESGPKAPGSEPANGTTPIPVPAQQTGEEAAEGEAAGEKTADGKAAEEKAADGKTADGKTAEGPAESKAAKSAEKANPPAKAVPATDFAR